jgi:protein TonB
MALSASVADVLPMPQRRPGRPAGLAFLVSAGVHVVLLSLALSVLAPNTAVERIRTLTVRILDVQSARPAPPQAVHQTPPPKRAPPAPAAPRPLAPILAATDAPAADFSVPPQPALSPAPAVAESPAPPAAPPTPRAPPAPPSPVFEPARFDADYLNNPRPAYPLLSRRLGEEGRVLLRVRISADGAPLSVETKQSSGYARLDAAAVEAVQQWRFVPARRGEAAVQSSVLVPLAFKLSR